MTDTGTGWGQAAEPQGGGLDLNWKPVALSDEEMQKNEQGKKGMDSFTTDPFIDIFWCLPVPEDTMAGLNVIRCGGESQGGGKLEKFRERKRPEEGCKIFIRAWPST